MVHEHFLPQPSRPSSEIEVVIMERPAVVARVQAQERVLRACVILALPPRAVRETRKVKPVDEDANREVNKRRAHIKVKWTIVI